MRLQRLSLPCRDLRHAEDHPAEQRHRAQPRDYEEAGGKMEVWSIPRFTLMLRLPEQEEAAHESDDR